MPPPTMMKPPPNKAKKTKPADAGTPSSIVLSEHQWRMKLLPALELPDRITDKLRLLDIVSVGELADQLDNPHPTAQEVFDEIGTSGVELIRSAIAAARGRDETGRPMDPAVEAAEREVVYPVQWIELDRIERDGQNHRLPNSQTLAKLQETADSLKTEGQLQDVLLLKKPEHVVVGQPNKPYFLCYGFRRTAAAEMLGWPKVRAQVRPMPMRPGDQEPDWEKIRSWRARENLDRENINPIEEMLIVTDELSANNHDVARTAANLNRSEKWVRDREYLSRLCDEVRAWVIDGSLPIKHAREIAKIGDEKRQVTLAEQARRNEDGTGGMSLERLSNCAGNYICSLRVVPWKLEEKFPASDRRLYDKGRPCAGCPHNSATTPDLFEIEKPSEKEIYCSNQSCFNAKEQIARSTIEKQAAKIVREKKPHTPAAIEQAQATEIPAFVKPASLSRAATKIANPEKAAAKTSPFPRETTAEREYQEKLRKWEVDRADAIFDAIEKTPNGVAKLLLLDNLALLGWRHTKDRAKQILKAKPIIKDLLAGKMFTPEMLKLTQLLDDKDNWFDNFRDILQRDSSPDTEAFDAEAFVDWLAGQFMLTFKPRPEDPTKKPAAEKKPDAKKKGGKGK